MDSRHRQDYAEITRYTVSAFVQMEAYMSKGRPPSPNPFHVVTDGEGDEMSTSGGSSVEESSPETPSADVDTSPVVVRNGVRAPTPRRGGPQVLPVFDFERVRESELGASGELQEVERLLARKGTATLRACDSCHVAATCPAFSPGSECAYHLPIEIRTKAQLSAALASLLEKQVDRVAFMVMQEDLNGGYADPNTGTEIDRLMSMVKSIKDIEDNREFVRFQVEAKAQGGVLSALFGEQAKQLAALDRPLPATVIEDIIDADPD